MKKKGAEKTVKKKTGKNEREIHVEKRNGKAGMWKKEQACGKAGRRKKL